VRPKHSDFKTNKIKTEDGTFLKKLSNLVDTPTEQVMFCKVFGFQPNIFKKINNIIIRR
jgi:hypothetical protein